jgi:hypothetical protein
LAGHLNAKHPFWDSVVWNPSWPYSTGANSKCQHHSVPLIILLWEMVMC